MYDIESFVQRNFRDDYKYYGNPPTDISICCPFCEERGSGVDTKYHLQIHIDPGKQVAHCFRCGYSASWVQFVMSVSGLSYVQAVGELYVVPRARVDLDEYISNTYKLPTPRLQREYDLPDDFRLLTKQDESRLARAARRYLRDRGFGGWYWKRYSIGVADSAGYRVIIPIERGYWQGRAIYDYITPKYLNPKELARDILFNANALEIYDEVVVCEGFFSAIAVGENALALIGKEPTKEKIARLIRSSAKHFIIALEAGAFPTMHKLADALIRNGKSVTIWHYEAGDPADTDKHTDFTYNLKTKLSFLLAKP